MAFENEPFLVYEDDLYNILPSVPDGSVDLAIIDPPYGQTKNKNDKMLDLNLLWEHLDRIVKPNGAVILFGQGIFSAIVMMSNPKNYRYSLVWKKGERVTGFFNSKKMPLRNHEDIHVFYRKPFPTYNPIMTEGKPLHGVGKASGKGGMTNNNYGEWVRSEDDSRKGSTKKFPKSVLNFEKPHPPLHPTEKPVALMEWLVKTYSNEGDVVLDPCCGVGPTGVASVRNGRKFIGIEKQTCHFSVAVARILKEFKKPKQLELFK
jgi:site-specific DNA-methyltransferase (adenine-specific)